MQNLACAEENGGGVRLRLWFLRGRVDRPAKLEGLGAARIATTGPPPAELRGTIRVGRGDQRGHNACYHRRTRLRLPPLGPMEG
jgi:hypothetical protein